MPFDMATKNQPQVTSPCRDQQRPDAAAEGSARPAHTAKSKATQQKRTARKNTRELAGYFICDVPVSEKVTDTLVAYGYLSSRRRTELHLLLVNLAKREVGILLGAMLDDLHPENAASRQRFVPIDFLEVSKTLERAIDVHASNPNALWRAARKALADFLTLHTTDCSTYIKQRSVFVNEAIFLLMDLSAAQKDDCNGN